MGWLANYRESLYWDCRGFRVKVMGWLANYSIFGSVTGCDRTSPPVIGDFHELLQHLQLSGLRSF